MGRVTFQDSEVIRRINRDFRATWKNVHPGYKVEHLEGARFEEIKRIPNGQASENVVTLICTPGGELLHVVPGHWKPKDYLKEIDFALSVAQAVARAGSNPDARRKAVVEMHREHLAMLDHGWDGGSLGRMVLENVDQRMVHEPLRRASEVQGVEDYALNRATSILSQKGHRLQQAAQQWQREGKDPRPVAEVMQVMQGIEPLLHEGKLSEAEARVDHALGLLGERFAPGDSALHPPRAALSPADLPESIRRKMQRASELAEQWQRDGKDLTPVARVMNQVEPLLRQGKLKEAEAVLDRGLSLLGASKRVDSTKPVGAGGAEGAFWGPDPGLVGALPAASRPATRAETPEALRAEIESLRAPHVAWREIAWKSCLLEGLKESRSQGKPALLWIFIDRPADDERC
jgi:hypothetical protein